MDRARTLAVPRGDTQPEARAQLRLPPRLSSPALARQLAAAQLEAWGLSDLSDIGLLLLSELATNAVRHGGTGFEVEVAHTGEGVHFRVTDHGGGTPRRAAPGPAAEGGRGLLLVDELASRWGVTRGPGCTAVWFELDRSPGSTGP